MPISPVSVGAAVTPTVIKTYISHYTNRSSRKQKPTAHISYDEGLHLIRSFLEYASHHTVEDLQAFTAQWVPNPSWVRTENVTIPQEYITKAADGITTQLGPTGVDEVGGTKWWQWRRKNAELKAEWIEMRADYNARKQLGENGKRIMLYVHGGAYFFGSVDEHRYQLQRHARKLKARVFAPRYRLAPQFPFPCGLHDCLAAYLYLLSVHDKTEILLAGDSAGGGMVVSMLCLLRDQGLPLPAGAILISPWVDLTHSFPSVAAGSSFDYIPPYGFMHKPSISWPPPNDDEMEAIRSGAGKDLVKGRNRLEKKEVEREAARGYSVHDIKDDHEAVTDQSENTAEGLTVPTAGRQRRGSDVPGPQRHLQLRIGDKMVELKDQIQMYATNQLISHPMVSSVLQPSLGGLCPLLILTGGGEVLRDEQIYLAHKAAHPSAYPVGEEYRARYDPDDKILNKYKPTPVQLQVWEDLCHVAPTLSFTRPAKFMYRSVAQFGAWALARAQNTSIDIMDDDEISIISTDSDESRKRKSQTRTGEVIGTVGKAGDPIPAFKHHMIRQRVDRHGTIYPLEAAAELPALKLSPSEVGVIKVGPVKKWMDAKYEWDTKYARIKRKVQKRRIEELMRGGTHSFEGEEPPPSALAGRRKDEDMMMVKPKKSYWLAIWGAWGSKHDEDTIKREEQININEPKGLQVNGGATGSTQDEDTKQLRRKSGSKSRSRSRQRKRLTMVSDAGQVEGDTKETPIDIAAADRGNTKNTNEMPMPDTAKTDGTTDTHLTPTFVPKLKTIAHLRSESRDISDTSSIRTGHSVVSPDDASTRAVFSAAGVSHDKTSAIDGSSLGAALTYNMSKESRPNTADTIGDRMRSDDQKSTFGGNDTPYSRRSLERLLTHQVDMDGLSLTGTEASVGPSSAGLAPRAGPLRSPSTVAIVQHEGVVDVVEGGVADPDDKVDEELPLTGEGLPVCHGTTMNTTRKVYDAPKITIEDESAPVNKAIIAPVSETSSKVREVTESDPDKGRTHKNGSYESSSHGVHVDEPLRASEQPTLESSPTAGNGIVKSHPLSNEILRSDEYEQKSSGTPIERKEQPTHQRLAPSTDSTVPTSSSQTKKDSDETPTEEIEFSISGAIPVVDGGVVKLARPGLYERNDAQFQTAMERL